MDTKLSQPTILSIIQQSTVIPSPPPRLSGSNGSASRAASFFSRRRIEWFQLLVLELDPNAVAYVVPVLQSLLKFLASEPLDDSELTWQVKTLQHIVAKKLDACR